MVEATGRPGPASRARAAAWPTPVTASSHVTGEGPPARFADVEMSGPALAQSRRARARPGTRTATAPVLAVTSTGTSAAAGGTNARGPGPTRRARRNTSSEDPAAR